MGSSQRPPYKRLPSKPNLKHLKHQAKQLLDAYRQGVPEALNRVQQSLQPSLDSVVSTGPVQLTLQQAQYIVAHEYGFANWSVLCESLKDSKNTWGKYAAQYAKRRETDEAKGIEQDLQLRQLLDFAGKVEGLSVLDAGCGEGYVARIMARRGARVTGIDVSSELIEIARSKDKEKQINYLQHDLSKPLPQYAGLFDLVVSNKVLSDVPDYRGFIATIGSLTRPGGRVALSMQNPYSAVSRLKVDHYFDTGTAMMYWGLAAKTGIKVFYYHRTMEEYITAFRENGFLLKNLSDMCPSKEQLARIPKAKKWYRMPPGMALEFIKQEP